MKMISANKLNRLWRNGVVAKMVAKTKVLKTIEEISANTSAENVAGATAVKELNNNLKQVPEFITDSATGKIIGYKTPGGADTVFPFRDNNFFMPEGQKLLIPKTITLNAAACSFCALTFWKKLRLLSNGSPCSSVYFQVLGANFISNDSDYIANAIKTDLVADNRAVFVCNRSSDSTVTYNKQTGIVENSDKCDVVFFKLATTGYSLENFTVEWLDE